MTRDDAPGGRAPPLRRRMAAFVYEGLLLFGVLMVSGWLYSSLTQQRHALQGRSGLQAFLFVVLGIYFIWFWSHGGQTVAMKTWRIRVETLDGQPLSQARALGRYVLSWLWFLPALGIARWSGLEGLGPLAGCVLAGAAAYALSCRLHPQHQFLHDRLAGTRIVDSTPGGRRVASTQG